MTTRAEPLNPGLLDAVAPHGFENFLTDAFCWLLSNVPGLGPDFLKFLRELQSSEPRCIPAPGSDTLHWRTQTAFPRKNKRAGQRAVRPDMTCQYGEHAVVFEHKTGSDLSPGQIKNYRESRENAGHEFRSAPIVLIAAYVGQHDQDPDLALCWRQVHGFLDERAKGTGDAGFAVREFQTLLKERGLGPMNRFKLNEIRDYFVVTDLNKNLKSLIKRMSQREWGVERNGDQLIGRLGRDGRLGLDLRPWNPGVFVGVILDGRDHGVKPRKTGLDASVILDVEESLQGQFQRFEELAKSLCDEGLPEEWEVIRHWKGEKVWQEGKYRGKPNPWHPLHIRKPLARVFGNATSWEDQADLFYRETRTVADLVLKHLNARW